MALGLVWQYVGSPHELFLAQMTNSEGFPRFGISESHGPRKRKYIMEPPVNTSITVSLKKQNAYAERDRDKMAKRAIDLRKVWDDEKA